MPVFRVQSPKSKVQSQGLPIQNPKSKIQNRKVQAQLRYAARTSRRLARALFHAMLRNGPKLERQQLLLGRFVDIGTELFAITATCLRAEALLQADPQNPEHAGLPGLVDYFCQTARLRIEEKFRAIRKNADKAGYRIAQQVLDLSRKKG